FKSGWGQTPTPVFLSFFKKNPGHFDTVNVGKRDKPCGRIRREASGAGAGGSLLPEADIPRQTRKPSTHLSLTIALNHYRVTI
ncbi:MAG: hypothetical protein LBO04_04140, partial [Spirochaetaceae bacterium]|nr:hypothetical protein [Spirochaetaceae bacterium]